VHLQIGHYSVRASAHAGTSLSPSEGERVGVRGAFDCIVTAKARDTNWTNWEGPDIVLDFVGLPDMLSRTNFRSNSTPLA